MTNKIDLLRQAVAQGWCHETTSHKEMDVVLAEASAQSVLAALPAVTDPQIERLIESNNALTRKLMGQTEALNGPIIHYVFGRPLDEVANILDSVDTLQATNARLVEALRFYGGVMPASFAPGQDGGYRARALLSELEAK